MTHGGLQMVMKNGFRSPAGILAILGLMGCPLWLWSTRWLPGTLYSSAWVGAVVIPGRCVAAAVEMWVVVSHLGGILQEDAVARDSKRLE